MRKMKMKLLLLAFLFVGVKLSAQVALIPATQINQVTSSNGMDGLDSDINDQYYAILYWTIDNSSNTKTYMNVYDASTYALIGSPIQIVADNPEISRVEIDDNNRIYVLYESNNTAYLKSYDVTGSTVNLSATQQVAFHSGVYSTGGEDVLDMSVCVSGSTSTILVATKRLIPNLNQHELVIKKYMDNLSLLGEQMIVQNLPVNDYASMSIDANQDLYTAVYNQLPNGQNTYFTEFRLYDISSSTPLNDYSFSSASYAPKIVYNGGASEIASENLALKQDGKVLYIERVLNTSSTRLAEINFTTQTRSVVLNDVKAVDVAVNDNFVITDGFEKYEMYDNANTYVHAYTVDEEISQPFGQFGTGSWDNVSWLRQFTIHNCQLLVGGKHGNDWSTYPNGTDDDQLYHQLFSPEVECDDIFIDIPETLYMCTNFEPICGPVSYGCDVYSYYWTDPNGNTVVTPTECFTPSLYGDYVLTLSVNGTNCIHKKYFTVSNEGDPISIDDVYYCKDVDGSPTLIGFDNLTGSQGISEIIWTYENGVPFSSGTNQQINYIQDGEYCVRVFWEDGCISETCFIVQECCAPEPDLYFYSSVGFTFKGGHRITVGPGQGAGAPGIIAEEFILYEFCDLEENAMPSCNSPLWYQVSSIQGNPTITGNVKFPYTINTNCVYKVVYRVTTECGETHESCQIVFYPKSFSLVLSPNPTANGSNATLSMTADSQQTANVEIRNIHTGNTVFTGELTSGSSITLNSTDLRIGSGIYTILVRNDDHSETLNWVIE